MNFGLCCCSVTKSCLAICDPMDCSTPGFSVLHYFLEFAQTHPLNQWCYLTISSSAVRFCFCFQSFPTLGSFPTRWLFASGGQSIGALTLATVLPINSQDWFPLGLTGLSSLKSKGLSRVFSSTTVRKHQFFSPPPSLWSKLSNDIKNIGINILDWDVIPKMFTSQKQKKKKRFCEVAGGQSRNPM